MDVNFWSIDSWKKREESQVEDATKAAAVIRSVCEGVGGPMNSNLQDDKVGDGTTSMVVWPRELLREAEKLLAMKIQPMTIITGYTGSPNKTKHIKSKQRDQTHIQIRKRKSSWSWRRLQLHIGMVIR
ncbi:T-complex protein 1 subunit beta [Tanacetum coccineum]